MSLAPTLVTNTPFMPPFEGWNTASKAENITMGTPFAPLQLKSSFFLSLSSALSSGKLTSFSLAQKAAEEVAPKIEKEIEDLSSILKRIKTAEKNKAAGQPSTYLPMLGGDDVVLFRNMLQDELCRAAAKILQKTILIFCAPKINKSSDFTFRCSYSPDLPKSLMLDANQLDNENSIKLFYYENEGIYMPLDTRNYSSASGRS